MKQEHILNILYELALGMSGETRVQPLLTKMLQRLMFHTSFPCGLFLSDLKDKGTDQVQGHLELTIGSHRLNQQTGERIVLPQALAKGPSARVDDTRLLASFCDERHEYRAGLRLPIGDDCVFLLLSTNEPTTELPVSRIFEPILNNFAKVLQLCRHNEAYLQRLKDTREQAEVEKRDSEEQLRLILNSTAEAIFGLDQQGLCTFANPACVRMLGYEQADELLGQNMHRLIHHSHADGSPYSEKECPIYQSARYSRGIHVEDEVLWRKDGSSFAAEYWSHPIRRENKIIGFVVTFVDISERKQTQEELRQYREQLEHKVAERTAALEAANKELESFSYSVSHDLRSPLRAIDGFSHALEEDLAGKLDETSQDYLRRVRSASQRMERLIDDMLKLSRVTRQSLLCEAIDLADHAHHIVAQLKETAPEKNIVVNIQEPLAAKADPRLIHIALFNLLDNAWKYTGKKDQAKVEVGVLKENDQQVYYIRDNGAGFDMRYANKLFGAFQRLHRETDFPGTGIGLATVARIIHRHHGKIWAEAEPDQGASFYFTLGDPVPDSSSQPRMA